MVVGMVCVDIVNYVSRFPDEDSDVGTNSPLEVPGGRGNRSVTPAARAPENGHAMAACRVFKILTINIPTLSTVRHLMGDEQTGAKERSAR